LYLLDVNCKCTLYGNVFDWVAGFGIGLCNTPVGIKTNILPSSDPLSRLCLVVWFIAGSCLGPPLFAALKAWWENAIATASMNTNRRGRRIHRHDEGFPTDSWEMERLSHGTL